MLTVRSGFIAMLMTVLTQLSRRLVGIVSLVILARILTPDDYGLVAIALIFLNFIVVISNTGGGNYLLSREILTEESVMTNWTLNVLLKGGLAVFFALSSYPISLFYNDPRLASIILVLSLHLVIGLFNSPGMIFKMKNQDLSAITKWQITSRFITTGITIAIAVVFETYWALVIGQLLVTISEFIASYVIAPMRPKFTLVNIRPQWEFSKWVLPQSIINFFRSQLDAMFVSVSFEKATVGAYTSMRYYADLPTSTFISPLGGPLLTQFSQFKNNHEYFQKQLQVVLFYFSLITAPVIYLMYVHSYFVVGLILGDKWIQYSDLLGIFAFFIIVATLNNTLSHIVMLKDRTKLLLMYSIYSTLIQCVMFISVDFSSVYELAEYKIGLDIVSVSLFFALVIGAYFGKAAFAPLLLPVLPPVAFIYCSGWVAFQVVPEVTSFWQLVLHCSITVGLFGLLQLAVILVLKQVHCYRYTLKLIHPVVKKCTARFSS